MRPFWLKAEFSCTHTHSIKITTRQSKGKIFQIHYCVLKAVTGITVKYFFNVTDREIVLAVKQKLLYKRSWIRGSDCHLPCMKQQVHLKFQSGYTDWVIGTPETC